MKTSDEIVGDWTRMSEMWRTEGLPVEIFAEAIASAIFLKWRSVCRHDNGGVPTWTDLFKRTDIRSAFLDLLQFEELSDPLVQGVSSRTRFANALTREGILDRALRNIVETVEAASVGERDSRDVVELIQGALGLMGSGVQRLITPASISTLIVAALDPAPDAAIYDPICGFGSLLFRTAGPFSREKQEMSLHGNEIHEDLALMGRLSLAVLGCGGEIKLVDSLSISERSRAKYDIVVANPPFGVHSSIEQPLANGEPRSISAPAAFLEHVSRSLSERGRGVVLVPNGLLFRSGTDHLVRKHLVESGRIKAVIGLPSHLFAGTPVVASLIFLAADSRWVPDGQVLFVDLTSSSEGTKTKRRLTTGGIREALRCLQAPTTPSNLSRLVAVAEVATNDYSLSVHEYIRTDNGPHLSFSREFAAFIRATQERRQSEERVIDMVMRMARDSEPLQTSMGGGQNHG